MLGSAAPKMHKSVLLISHSFPPDAEVGGKRIAQFSRYLPEFGFKPFVLAVDERFSTAVDTSFLLPKDLAVYRTRVLPNPLEWYVRFKKSYHARRSGQAAISHDVNEQDDSQSGSANGPGFLGWAREQVLSIFNSPNDDCGWYLPGIRKARGIVESEGVKTVLSSGPPWAAHLIAFRLRRIYGMRWIADFRDPWTAGPEWEMLPRWRRVLEKRLEKLCMHSCDVVVSNTDRIREEFVRRFPELTEEKFVTITNGFVDPPSLLDLTQNSDRLLMLHLGSLYGVRQSRAFFEAISNIVVNKRSPHIFKVLLIGDNDPVFVKTIMSQFPHLFQNGCVEFRERVNWQKAQHILWSASALLLFQGGYTLQVPAKFYEYLPTGKPMLVIAQDGALTDIAKSTGLAVCAPPNDVEAIEEALLQIFMKQAKTSKGAQAHLARFHYRYLTGQLSEIL